MRRLEEDAPRPEAGTHRATVYNLKAGTGSSSAPEDARTSYWRQVVRRLLTRNGPVTRVLPVIVQVVQCRSHQGQQLRGYGSGTVVFWPQVPCGIGGREHSVCCSVQSSEWASLFGTACSPASVYLRPEAIL